MMLPNKNFEVLKSIKKNLTPGWSNKLKIIFLHKYGLVKSNLQWPRENYWNQNNFNNSNFATLSDLALVRVAHPTPKFSDLI